MVGVTTRGRQSQIYVAVGVVRMPQSQHQMLHPGAAGTQRTGQLVNQPLQGES